MTRQSRSLVAFLLFWYVLVWLGSEAIIPYFQAAADTGISAIFLVDFFFF